MFLNDYPAAALANKVVLVRTDLNLPTATDGGMLSHHRLAAAVHTVRHLVACRARVMLLTHLGRPTGRDDKLSTRQLQPVLRKALPGVVVGHVDDCVGPLLAQAVQHLPPGCVALLENVRFHAGETANDPSFAAALMRSASVFVFDAFGVAHRCHASTVGVIEVARSHNLPVMAGMLVRRELLALSAVLRTPQRPLLAIVGGDKLTSKADAISALVRVADVVALVGRVAVPFVCDSASTEAERNAARLIRCHAADKATPLMTPSDFVVQRSRDADSATTVPASSISATDAIMDVGNDTMATLANLVSQANTILWNGPAGVFETPPFGSGTKQLIALLSAATHRGATTVVGGGHTVAAIERCCSEDACFSHVSTGGGAMMAVLSGRSLPAVDTVCCGSTPASPGKRGALEEVNRDCAPQKDITMLK